ncbi:nitrate- and nitrite sensing domain-containing protein [Streptomyces sp. NPDC091292]|uniref:sensor histidine kinase n=1 Tax=Streptomyces sp. NPDC091292 TaxID=3365991 RepID=UPI0038032653
MRAPVQKLRPRRKGGKSASQGAQGAQGAAEGTPAAPGGSGGSGGPPQPGPRGRRKRVRSRLIISVAVVAAAIAGAGAPAVVAASADANDAQNLVVLAERTQQAVTLANALADERDEVTAWIAAGRPEGKGLSEQRSARVDRRVQELRAEAPAPLRDDLDAVAAARRAALTGKDTALAAHQAYAKVISALHLLTEDLAEQTPPDAGSGLRAFGDLDRAVEQASAARGLLLAAYAVPHATGSTTTIDPVTGLAVTVPNESEADTRARGLLSAAAQEAHVRERAALADFHDSAPAADASSYDSTVNGPSVTAAEKYLADLTDQPTLSDGDLKLSAKKIDAALTARVDLMRGVEASFGTARVKQLEQLRDDEVTALEIRVAVTGVLLLLAVGVSMGMARSLTRPLSVLRRGSARLAADPATDEPIRFTGRNDEFAEVVRSVNALHAHALALHERLTTLESDRRHLVGQRESMADERARTQAELADAAERLERARGSIQGTFVNLALRTLGLVERQLAVIENLEDREQDPDRLATLFKLDHFATVMRRHSENLLVLAGAEHVHQHPGPVPLVDVARAAVSEIERYERVRITSLPQHAHVAGFAADDLSHLVAELLENATSFSPPDATVEVSGWLLENGEVMLSVQDEGIGMTSERLRELNVRLSDFDPEDAGSEHGAQDDGSGLGLGLYVVARLAHRHGVRVQLREQKQGGVAAVAVLPKALLAAEPAAAVAPRQRSAPPVAGAAPSVALPGSEAEANSNVLPVRRGHDPLIAAAERAVHARESETTLEFTAPVPPDRPAPEPVPGPVVAAGVPDADAHHRAADEAPRVTGKGLPKRTPKISETGGAPVPQGGGVDAEALRRKLGGFHQGAKAGRRDVEAELTAEVEGDIVEEASS